MDGSHNGRLLCYPDCYLSIFRQWLGFLVRSLQSATWEDQPVNQVPNSPTGQVFPQPATIDSPVSLEPTGNWRDGNHVHGLAVNPANPQIIFVATHNGLLQRSASGEWFWMGKQRADYMGFTADLTNPNRFYSSGHPSTGGNLGFQISDTQGEDWQQISMPGVDFHALAIAPSNPNVFYDFPTSGAAGIYRSIDGGKTWTQPRMTGLAAAPFNLVVDPQNSEYVFAATQAVLYKSTNSGNDWILVPGTQDAPIALQYFRLPLFLLFFLLIFDKPVVILIFYESDRDYPSLLSKLPLSDRLTRSSSNNRNHLHRSIPINHIVTILRCDGFMRHCPQTLTRLFQHRLTSSHCLFLPYDALLFKEGSNQGWNND